jgi:hypothetical protein
MLEIVTITSKNISLMQPMRQKNMDPKGHHLFSLGREGVLGCIFIDL